MQTQLERRQPRDPMSASITTGAARIPRGEFVRKALHMLPGLLPFGFAFVPHPDTLDLTAKVVVTLVTVLLTGLFLAVHRIVRRHGEDNFRSTVLSYPLTVVSVLLLFPSNSEFAGVVTAILAFGDGSAYFGGKLIGGPRLPWNRQKTWAGTISFVVCSAPVAALAYWMETNYDDLPVWIAIACGLSAATAGTIAESLPVRLTDNLRVGIAAALGVIAAHYTLVRVVVF